MTFENIIGELDRCNKCGFCQSACPTFQATGFEWSVTRGRVSLVQDLIAGTIDLHNPELAEAIDTCLVCGACIEVCPPQVQIHDIIYAVRQARLQSRPLPLSLRFILRGLLPRPGLLRAFARFGRLGQKLLNRRRFRRWAGGTLARAMVTGPKLPGTTARRLIGRRAPVPNPRARVAYFMACTKDIIYPRAAKATVAVLEKNGVDVIIPPVVCCGLPCQSAGDIEGARQLAIKNLECLDGLNVDAIVCDEGSCTAHLADYPELLAGTPHQKKAEAFAAQLVDFSVFLDRLPLEPMTHPVPVKVTWHDPCGLRHYLGVADAPRRLIQSIPGITYVEAVGAGMCCGGAGAIMITQPELSDEVLALKVNNLEATHAEYVITSSPSCVMQIERGGFKVQYLSELLAAGYGITI